MWIKAAVVVLVQGIASAAVFGAVHQTDVMLDPISAVDVDSVLVVDLDNTVFESAQMLGSSQWFEHLVQSYRKSGLSEPRAYSQAIGQWMVVQNATEVRPVEKATPNFITGLQTMGINVIALTARPPESARRTLEQLGVVGIDFSRSPVFGTSLEMPFKRATALYMGGVLFADRLDKGGVLAAFFDRIKYKPKRIVYVDDQRKHVEAVQKAMRKVGIAFDGFRYGGADGRVKAFDPEVAELQFKYFGRILSDDAATQIRMLGE